MNREQQLTWFSSSWTIEKKETTAALDGTGWLRGFDPESCLPRHDQGSSVKQNRPSKQKYAEDQ